MKALTVRQPWANAIFQGVKKIETRPRRTHIRGTVAIHAGLAWNKAAADLAMTHDLLFIQRDGLIQYRRLGAIIGYVDIVDCVPVEDLRGLFWLERQLGDYTPGRFGYILENPRLLPEPVYIGGQLGFWNWEPEGVVLA